MRNSTKIALLIAGILLVAGGVCWSLALVLIRGDWQRLSLYSFDTNEQQRTYTVPAEEVTSLRIDTKDHTVRILVEDTDQIQINYVERQNETYQLNVDDQGYLTVLQQTDRNWIQNWFPFPGWDSAAPDLVLTLPASLAGGAEIHTTSGNLYMEALSLSGPLQVETTSGDVKLTRIHIDDTFAFSSTSGDLQVDQCEMGKNENHLKTTSGDMALIDCQIHGNLQSTTSSGEASFLHVSITGDLSIRSTSGDLQVEAVSAQNFSFNTSSGDIAGVLWGDETMYSVQGSTTSGDVYLPTGNSQGVLSLVAKTTSGDIHLTMEPSSEESITRSE